MQFDAQTQTLPCASNNLSLIALYAGRKGDPHAVKAHLCQEGLPNQDLHNHNLTCSGENRNNICVLSLLDLPLVLHPDNRCLLQNKFGSAVDPWVVPCLQQILNIQ